MFKVLIFLVALIGTILVYPQCPAKDIKVLVIDSGIDKNIEILKPYLSVYPKKQRDINNIEDLITNDWEDLYGHGSHVAGIIAESHCDKLRIYSCNYVNGDNQLKAEIGCLYRAAKEHMDVVNLSGGGRDYSVEEDTAMKVLERLNIKVIVAAGNDSHNLGSPCFGYFPACLRHKNMTVVGAYDNNVKRAMFSNYGIPGMKWQYGVDIYSTLPGNRIGPMSGTSQATAVYTRGLIKEMCQ